MDEGAWVHLPHGLHRAGRRHDAATVRALTGRDEADLAAARASGHGTQDLADRLLGRCTRLPADAGVDDLSLGDREALLLHLYAASLGPVLHCVLSCPDCGADMDLDVPVRDLLHAPHDGRASYPVDVDGRTVRVRVPTRGDQRAAARDPDGADALLRRCAGEPPEDPEARARWTEAVAAAMQRHDPQAETLLEAACPDCGAPTSALLDAAGFLVRDVEARARNLRWDVHTLAYHYHWPASEILAMSGRQRRDYCAFLESALEVGP